MLKHADMWGLKHHMHLDVSMKPLLTTVVSYFRANCELGTDCVDRPLGLAG